MSLKDRVAIVTGAGSGIGRATALRLAQEGVKVAVVDWNVDHGNETVKLVTEQGHAGLFIEADISKVNDTERMVHDAVAEFGKLDVLVNCAAIMLEKTIVDTTEADFDRVIGINLKGTFFCARQAVIQFRKQQGGGNIVNIASINSFVGEAAIAAYATAKGGVAQLTRALAIDHSGEGIRVNAICPGWVDTPMNAKFFALGPHIREQAARLHAIGRIGQPEDVANAVAFLASDEASFITGSMLMVDGGFTAGLAPTVGVDLAQHRAE